MRTASRQRGWRTWFRRLVVLGFLATFAALLTGWLAFQHKPSWYRPVALDEEGKRQARAAATRLVDDISDQIVLGNAFEITITANAINEWIVMLPEFYPEARIDMPPELSQPTVGFVEGQLRLASLGESQGINAIVSLGCHARVSENGRMIRLALANIQGGSLPIPRVVLAPLIEDLLAPALDKLADQDSLGTYLAGVRDLDDLYQGVEIRNQFTWPNGDRLFRIESIRFAPDEVRLRIDPL